MYIRVKITCECGCKFEIDQPPEWASGFSPCPSCRQALSENRQSLMYGLFNAAKNAGDLDPDAVKVSFHPRLSNPHG